MSSTENYQSKLAEITAIKDDQVKTPSMPVAYFNSEAESLSYSAKRDREKLEHVGCPAELIDDIDIRNGALRYAQVQWDNERKEMLDAQEEWKEKGPATFDLRDQLLFDFRFAFRSNSKLIERLQEIAEGSSNPDLIEDLLALALLGDAHKDMLEAVNYDLSQIEVAKQTADYMADVLGAANGDKYADRETLTIRNKAYTHLKEAVDEIRTVGKYVFANDDKYRSYISEYYKRRSN